MAWDLDSARGVALRHSIARGILINRGGEPLCQAPGRASGLPVLALRLADLQTCGARRTMKRPVPTRSSVFAEG